MGLITAYTIIRAISICHLTAAYFFLTAPRVLADQNVVFMLGESMRLSHITTMDKPNEASAFIAVILIFFGIADLSAASLDEIPALEYWLNNVPMRLIFLFGLTAYTYLFKEGGMLGPEVATGSIGELLHNSMVFSWAFFELMAWFWVFISLRDERRNLAQRIMERRKAEEDSL